MQFNPVDKSISIIADIDFLLFGSSATFNDSYSLDDRTRNVNISMDEVVSELFKADPNFMWDDTTNPDFPIATLNLTANADHYTIPDESLIIHRLRIKDQNGKFKTLTPCLRRELTDSDLEATGTPSRYYKIDNGIFPVPVPNYGATLGVELEFQRGANYFIPTDTSKKPGFSPQFHQYLSVGAAYRYAIANSMKEKKMFLDGEKTRILSAVREHYARRSPDERPRLRLRKPSVGNFGLS